MRRCFEPNLNATWKKKILFIFAEKFCLDSKLASSEITIKISKNGRNILKNPQKISILPKGQMSEIFFNY